MNNVYHPDVFYNINDFDVDTRIKIINDVYAVSSSWCLDILKPGLIRREKVNCVDYQKAMSLADDKSLFVFIHRKGYPNWDWRLEAGFTTLTSPDYFLFVYADECYIPRIVERYNLEVMK